jgi:hypothetical protein
MINMPNLGPESYTFLLYVSYAGASTNPSLTIYWPEGRTAAQAAVSAEPDLLERAENQDFETQLVIERVVTESAAHMSTITYTAYLPEGKIEVKSALDYLEQVDVQGYGNFLAECWTSASARLTSAFPKRFPASPSRPA